MKQQEFEKRFQFNNIVTLTGYTSTTLVRDIALGFALGDLEEKNGDSSLKSVLLEIEFHGDGQFFFLNS